jgi:single-strand DNA-binding protein
LNITRCRASSPTHSNQWITRENEPQSGVHIDAESIALNLVRVEQVIFQARQRRDGEATEVDPPSNEGVGPTEFDRPEDEAAAAV